MSLISELKSEWKKAVIGLIVVFLIAKWDYVVATFDAGKSVEQEVEFEKNLTKALNKPEIVKLLLENKEFVKLLFESKIVQENIDKIGVELHDKIVEDVTKSDTNKVSMRSFVGMEAGIRDEQVLPILGEIVKAWNEGEITTKKDVDEIIRRRARVATF